MKSGAGSLKNLIKLIIPLPNLSKEKRKDINKITNKKGEITSSTTEIQIIIKEYFDKFICQQIGQCRRNE